MENEKRMHTANDQTERVYIFPIFLGYSQSIAREVILKAARSFLICEMPTFRCADCDGLGISSEEKIIMRRFN